MRKYLYQTALSSNERALLQKKFNSISDKKFINEDFYAAEDDYAIMGRRLFSIQDNGDFVSVNSFFGQRKRSNLARLNSFYLDLDIQKNIDSNFNSFDSNIVKEYAYKVINKCLELNIPSPTRMVSTGNGIHVYWDLGTEDDEIYGPARKIERKFKSIGVSKEMIKVYLAIQKKLINNFKDLGADSACKDVSRVLRVPGSSTKNGDVAKEILKKHQVDYEALCVISDFVNLLDYSYDEYKKWLYATEKQRDFVYDLVKEGSLDDSDLSALEKATRFSISSLIRKGVMNRPATINQINAIKKNNIKKLNYLELSNLTMGEADIVIKETINRNTNYISNYLTYAYRKGFVKEGKRSMFTYYFAIGQSLLYPNMELEELTKLTLQKWEEFSLDLEKDEALKYIVSGLSHDGVGIRKQTLIDFFEGDLKLKQYNKKNVIKSNREKIEELIKKDIVENTQRSLREIAGELGVSHTYVKKIKDIFRKKTQEKLLSIKEERIALGKQLTKEIVKEIIIKVLNLGYDLKHKLSINKAFEIYIDLSLFEVS